MESDLLTKLFPDIALAMRAYLSNLHLAISMMASPEQRENDPVLDAKCARIDQSFYQILRLVNQLSAAVYLTDDAPLQLRNRDISDVVDDLCNAAGDLAPLRGISFSYVNHIGHHFCAISTDATEQILYNLLSNAFKFTRAGGSVKVELLQKKEQILLKVTDTGCGISREQMETLFCSYANYDPMKAYPRGLGLGLALCRCLAQKQGGALVAKSKVGEGSTFTLSIPDRQIGYRLSDHSVDYTGGFNQHLLGLADALPERAFLEGKNFPSTEGQE